MSKTATTVWPDPQRRRFAYTLQIGRRFLGHAVVALAAAWLIVPNPVLASLLAGASLAVLISTWLALPARLTNPVSASIRGRYWGQQLKRSWPDVGTGCELNRGEQTPQVRRVVRRWPRLDLVVRPLTGQTYSDFEQAAEAMRLSVGAAQIRVEPSGVRDVSLTFTMGDELASPFDASVPASATLDSVPMGLRSDGGVWRLPIGPHTLVAGSSGSGKGSIFWSFAFGLAPAVRDGRVQLHGIDLKGGMEILMGSDLFTTKATSAAEAVVVLEMLVGWMRERTASFAGRLRTHAPTVDQPLHVVMFDELAALTAYCTDRDLQRRAEAAINLLCSQGRAPGFMVFACLQDPRKEVIPSRGLFTQMVGLRLKDLSETSMVLGEVAVLSGAHCHRITRLVPGTAYVTPEDGGHPIRVRAGFATDEAIRDVAQRFATPTQLPIKVPVVPEPPAVRRDRRPRSTEAL